MSKMDQLRALRETNVAAIMRAYGHGDAPAAKAVTKRVTPVTAPVTDCPTCGRKLRVHQSAAAKQKAYRERRKAVSNV